MNGRLDLNKKTETAANISGFIISRPEFNTRKAPNAGRFSVW